MKSQERLKEIYDQAGPRIFSKQRALRPGGFRVHGFEFLASEGGSAFSEGAKRGLPES